MVDEPEGPALAPDVQLPSQGELDYEKLHLDIVETLREIFDPEIPVNIYDMGLIYAIVVDEQAMVDVKMTLTSPSCPEAQSLPPMVEQEIKAVPGVSGAKVEVVWDPPWSMDRMGEAARLQLGYDF
jgi:FeS assembly SUF system protein